MTTVYLNVAEAAAAIGVGRRTVDRLIASGQLPASRPLQRGPFRIALADVQRVAEEGRLQISTGPSGPPA